MTDVVDGVPLRPCVRCGYCCKKARCALSLIAEGRYTEETLPSDPFVVGLLDEDLDALREECPYLRGDGPGSYRCGLLDSDSPVDEEMVREWLSIGEGCSSSLNSDRLELVKRLAQESEAGARSPV